MIAQTTRFATLASACLAIAASSVVPAAAADYRLPPPPMVEPHQEIVPLGSGWYLRGDIGYVKPVDPEVELFNSGFGTFSYSAEKLDPSLSLGIGAGYKFTNWLRTDITLDYRFAGDFSGQVVGRPQQAKIGGYLAMANAYLDLGSWSGLSPYIGAGIGLAQTEIEDYYSNALLAGTRNDDWTLAWSLMGGVAVNVGANFILDLGYRYLNVSDASVELNALEQIKFKDLKSHEFRIGFRYMIDGM